ncbi:MLO-like protein 6, partial [Linum perenne]
ISSTVRFCGLLQYCYCYLTHMIILVVGTKLQVIITQLGLRIQERGDVVSDILSTLWRVFGISND